MAGRPIEGLRSEAEELLGKVRAERDELHLKIHLAKAEVRDEWAKLEPRWEHFQARVHGVAASAGAASQDISAALGLLAEELRHGYARIRQAMHA